MRRFDGRQCQMCANKQHVVALLAKTHQGHQHKHITSFRSQSRTVSFGYSVSGFQGVVWTLQQNCHGRHRVTCLQPGCQVVSTFLARPLVC